MASFSALSFLLAGMALVFPGFMMMQLLSAGAIGGGISSAIARALGAGRRQDADALAWHLLDSGALYRAVGYAAGMEGLDLSDTEAVTRCAQHTITKSTARMARAPAPPAASSDSAAAAPTRLAGLPVSAVVLSLSQRSSLAC